MMKPNVEDALLELKVFDPACGSGHFLVAAAQRIARRVVLARTGESAPEPEVYRHALRQVIGRCIYGVDLNPMAVELCKVSLWLESVDPGKPLSFLDHHIVHGNSLMGVTPELLALGVPDSAFKALDGDDTAIVNALKRRNKEEREGQATLPFGSETEPLSGSLRKCERSVTWVTKHSWMFRTNSCDGLHCNIHLKLTEAASLRMPGVRHSWRKR